MPLNYSKWDPIEISDDSDIEGHPNVDKNSLIRWKQLDIHEKREMRKQNIAKLQAQIACNNVLLPRIKEIARTLAEPATSIPPTTYFNSLVERLTKNPSRDCPPSNDPNKLEQTYDGMLLSLLKQVGEDARVKVKEAGVVEAERDEKLTKFLAELMAVHVGQLGQTISKDTAELEKEEKEQRKHITMDNLRDGFESKYVPPPKAPEPAPLPKIDKAKTSKTAKTEIEVLNPKAATSTSQAAENANAADEDDEEAEVEEERLPELTPSLMEFSMISVRDYETSFKFIQDHRDVYVSGASDLLLVAGFRAQTAGQSKYAKQCVHQSLLLQYCEKLGNDGIRMFFRKMIAGDPRAESVFVNDVENTYSHLVERVKISLEEESAGKEQIQLVPENPNQTITFNVPDGPPPEELVLEGPDTENLDIEEVRKALQFRWDVFEAFPQNLQEALKKGELDAVNQVLGDMVVDEAENVVQQLDMAGILSFAEGGIRDETGKGKTQE